MIFNSKSEAREISVFERELSIHVPAQTIINEVSKAYARLAQTAALKGFRKGKVPKDVLVHFYGEKVRKDVFELVINTALRNGMQEHGFQPVSQPEIKPAGSFALDQDFSFTATFQIKPTIELSKWEGFNLEVPEYELSDSDIDERVTKFKGTSIQDGAQAATDDQLRDTIKQLLESMKSYHERTARESAVTRALIENNPFELPTSLIEEQCAEMAISSVRAPNFEEAKKYWEEHGERLKEEARPKAIEILRSSLLLEAIGKKLELNVTEDELAQEFLQEAQRLNIPRSKIKAHYRNADFDRMRHRLMLRKALAAVVEKCDFSKTIQPFSTILPMNEDSAAEHDHHDHDAEHSHDSPEACEAHGCH